MTKSLFLKDLFYSTVTDCGDLTNFPFLTFTFQFKLDKKGNVIDGEYGEFDIVFVGRV